MDEMLTPKEAAEYLRLSVYTVKDYARRGVLPAAKVGGVWRFSKKALSDWLAGSTLSAAVMTIGARVARDSEPTGSIREECRLTGFDVVLDRRRAASDAIDAIRARGKAGSLREILDEHRDEVRKRSEWREE